MPPDFALEDALGGLVCGVDEAGRGPWAGPVVAGAAVLDRALAPPALLAALNDSKKLSEPRREALFAAMADAPGVVTGLGVASVEEIERHNILRATLLAMTRAVAALTDALGRPVDAALVDGDKAPPLTCRVKTVVKGDALSCSVAAASIIAKVSRDRMMKVLAEAHPGYGWEHNAGYGTAEHHDALRRLGVTPHHRRGYAPIRALLETPDDAPKSLL